jgi:hypothetical protein
MAKEGMGQEIKPGASAVALDPRGDRKKSPKWVMSWHNVSLGKGGNFRIWVSSFGEGINARVVQGFHVERMGETFRPISTTEYAARYDLLRYQEPSLEDGFITSEAIRKLGVGAILEVHSRALTQYIDKRYTKPLSPVEDYLENYFLYSVQREKSKITAESSKTIKSTNADAIFVTAVYAYLAANGGSSRLVKRTAQTLGIDSSTVYTAVRIARLKKWLTTLGKGVAGGTLSPTGEAALRDLKQYSRYLAVIGEGKGNK